MEGKEREAKRSISTEQLASVGIHTVFHAGMCTADITSLKDC
jgi:hypothetical protein